MAAILNVHDTIYIYTQSKWMHKLKYSIMERRLMERLGWHASRIWQTRYGESLFVRCNRPRHNPPLQAGIQALRCPNKRRIPQKSWSEHPHTVPEANKEIFFTVKRGRPRLGNQGMGWNQAETPPHREPSPRGSRIPRQLKKHIWQWEDWFLTQPNSL
jgi:hypothetical protein